MKSNLKPLFWVYLFTWLLVACSPESDPDIPVESIKLTHRALTLITGESTTVEAEVLPVNASDQTLVWDVTNKDIVEVVNGTIKAKKKGETSIIVKCGNKKSMCFIRVTEKKIPTQAISIPEEITMKVNDIKIIDLTLTPVDATDKVEWYSDNEKVVTVVNGEATAREAGKATITAKSGSCEAKCLITVNPQDVKIKSFEIETLNLTLKEGNAELIKVKLDADRPEEVEIGWTSSNKNVATVTHGRVNALSIGKTIITATAGRFTAQCQVEVIENKIVVESISLEPAELEIKPGQTNILKLKILPEDIEAPVEWISEDENIVKVNNYGLVTGINVGHTVIKATLGGKTATSAVTVASKAPAESFNVEIFDIIATNAKIIITPKDNEMTYYFYCMTKFKYEKELAYPGTKDISDFDMAFWKAQGGDRWKDAMALSLVKGRQESFLEDLLWPMWDTDFVFYCYGIDKEGVKTTDILIKEFRTPVNGKSDNKFTFTLYETFSDGFTGKVTTTNNDGYYMNAQPKSFFDFYRRKKEAGELINGMDPYKAMLRILLESERREDRETMIVHGDFEIPRNHFGYKKPKKDYELMIVGFDRERGQTTEMHFFSFKTKPKN